MDENMLAEPRRVSAADLRSGDRVAVTAIPIHFPTKRSRTLRECYSHGTAMEVVEVEELGGSVRITWDCGGWDRWRPDTVFDVLPDGWGWLN